VDHATIARWTLRYAPVLNQQVRRQLQRPKRPWRGSVAPGSAGKNVSPDGVEV
jgi:hypothetical protein